MPQVIKEIYLKNYYSHLSLRFLARMVCGSEDRRMKIYIQEKFSELAMNLTIKKKYKFEDD